MRDALELHAVSPAPEVALPVRFAGLVVSLDACMLIRDSGEAIPLTRGEFALLRMFVTRPGRVISRDTLLDAFTNRRFEPFDRSIDVLIGRLRRKVETDPKTPRLIVTVPGEGYRFDGLTQSLSSEQKPSIAVQASPDDGGRPNEFHGSDPPFAERSAGFGEAGGAKTPISECGGPPRLSIVVLPFANFGGDPEQDYFVDGVTDSLTTDLSRIRGAFVISRSTAFTYKRKGADVRQIGRDLNVRYVLEGSVQRGGNRIRVNVQLLEAETASHIWAERFDKPVADLFDMQNEIVSRLANGLGQELMRAEAGRAERSAKPDSMDFYFQGLAWFDRGIAPDNVAQTRSFFDLALSVDPANVDALVGSAGVDVVEGALLFTTDRSAAFAAAEAKLTKALSSVPDHARGHMWLGVVDIFTKRAAEGIAECQHALALDRNLASARAMIGYGKIFIGRADETEAHIAEALRLSPRDTLAYIWMSIAGDANNHLGNWEQAVEWFRRALEANRNYPTVYFNLAAALAHLGRLDEAHSAVRAGLVHNPTYALSNARATRVARSDDQTYLDQLESIFEGMRQAGVPER
jgi:TolB-like protein/DNA-binding winged helix-turn-helix (wHTH) protein/Flp pilus assembly protein TadD